jgi:hypothetical protein
MTSRASSESLPAEASMIVFLKRASPWWSPILAFFGAFLLR